MKRILLPENANAFFLSCVPESATSAVAANEIIGSGKHIAILVEEDLPKAEEWAEDVTGIMECLRPDLRVAFHTFDHPPESSNPDAFERACDRIATLSSLLDLSRRGSADGELSSAGDLSEHHGCDRICF